MDNKNKLNDQNDNNTEIKTGYILDYKENTKQFLRDQEKSIDFITDNIYIGDVLFSLDKDELKKYNITHILVCAIDLQECYPNDFTYKTIPLYDSEYTNISKYFEESNEFIKSSKDGKVFVHCGAGMSRSVSMVLAFLIGVKGMGYGEALELVRSKRKISRPNQGFEKYLRNYSYEKNKKF